MTAISLCPLVASSALVGPNGAGKTTLLHCAVGLCTATNGSITVLGDLAAGSLEALERVAFVAQDAPLYKYLSVRSMVAVARNLNSRFDQAQAEERLRGLEIRPDRKVGKLSGGQQAQLAFDLGARRRSRPPRVGRAACTARPARPPRFHGTCHGRGRGRAAFR